MAVILTSLKDFYINTRGFHTDRKLIVFESDDWGSIRMPSRSVFEKLRSMGDKPENDAFLRNDCLENENDLLKLYDVLDSVIDSNGNHPIFTFNFAMANPDFDNIDVEKGIYRYEPFYETYEKYYGKNSILDFIREGISRRLILPQLHCREHLNVGRWMRDLKEKKADTLLALECRTMGVGASFHSLNKFGYMDAFNTDCSSDAELERIIDDAVEIFDNVFGYRSQTFVASCFVWNEHLEKCLKKHGLYCIQSSSWQNKPVGTNGIYNLKRVIHYTGQRNRDKQMYSVRNCSFEPAYNQNPQQCVDSCLVKIDSAFKSKKPAIINTHRLNFIGSINPQNREENLKGLKSLLDYIVDKYPDVEFVSSAELFTIMTQETK